MFTPFIKHVRSRISFRFTIAFHKLLHVHIVPALVTRTKICAMSKDRHGRIVNDKLGMKRREAARERRRAEKNPQQETNVTHHNTQGDINNSNPDKMHGAAETSSLKTSARVVMHQETDPVVLCGIRSQ